MNDRTDSNHYRNRGQLIRKRLKLTAVPSVFLELPLHLQPQQTVQRSTAAISTTRWENTLEEHDNVNNNFLNADTVSNVGDIKSHLETSNTLSSDLNNGIFLYCFLGDGKWG